MKVEMDRCDGGCNSGYGRGVYWWVWQRGTLVGMMEGYIGGYDGEIHWWV